MEMMIGQLLVLGAVFIISSVAVVVLWRRTSYAVPPALQRVKVRDPVVARRMLFDHADAFSDRGLSLFPADFNAGLHLKRYSINTVVYGPLWRAFTCNLTAGIFHPSRLGRLVPLQLAAVDALAAGLSSRAGAGDDVVAVHHALDEVMFPLTVRLCFGDGVDARRVRALYGEMQEFFREVVAARALAASRLARVRQWSRWRRFVGSFERVIDLCAPLIEARRRRSWKRDNSNGRRVTCYVDTLLSLQVPDPDDDDDDSSGKRRRGLRNDEISALVWEFLGAGTWPIVANIEWTLAQLVTHPEVQTKLYREVAVAASGGVLTPDRLRGLPYLRAVTLESLRLHPSVPFIIRDAAGADAAEVCGGAQAALAACPLVNFVVSAREVARNRGAWTDPDEFVPERFLPGGEGEHVGAVPGPKEIKMKPFGAGRRACPGAGLAMAQVKMVIARLVCDFEWAPPPKDGKVDLRSAMGFFNVMKTPLSARITPRTY